MKRCFTDAGFSLNSILQLLAPPKAATNTRFLSAFMVRTSSEKCSSLKWLLSASHSEIESLFWEPQLFCVTMFAKKKKKLSGFWSLSLWSWLLWKHWACICHWLTKCKKQALFRELAQCWPLKLMGVGGVPAVEKYKWLRISRLFLNYFLRVCQKAATWNIGSLTTGILCVHI